MAAKSSGVTQRAIRLGGLQSIPMEERSALISKALYRRSQANKKVQGEAEELIPRLKTIPGPRQWSPRIETQPTPGITVASHPMRRKTDIPPIPGITVGGT